MIPVPDKRSVNLTKVANTYFDMSKWSKMLFKQQASKDNANADELSVRINFLVSH
jgi:hypothetical protein